MHPGLTVNYVNSGNKEGATSPEYLHATTQPSRGRQASGKRLAGAGQGQEQFWQVLAPCVMSTHRLTLRWRKGACCLNTQKHSCTCPIIAPHLQAQPFPLGFGCTLQRRWGLHKLSHDRGCGDELCSLERHMKIVTWPLPYSKEEETWLHDPWCLGHN